MTRLRPTSSDVATLAGVSRATVSYVLNDVTGQSIPEATRRRVRDAAAELGYTPHAAARALRGGSSSLVLLVVRGTPYGRNLGIVVDRLAERAGLRGWSLVTWQAGPGLSLRTTLGHLQPRLVLSLFPLQADEQEVLDRLGVPHAAAEETPGMSPDQELTAVFQVHHLAERGHRFIGYLGTDDPELAAFAQPRLSGARRGCLELSLPAPRQASIHVPPAGTVDDVVAVLRRWRSGPAPVTAVAAYNDYLAAACLRAAASLGLRVPEDLAVIGIDDEPMSALLDPPLTTVRLEMAALADRLFAVGLARSEGRPEPLGLSSSTIQLVVRGTT